MAKRNYLLTHGGQVLQTLQTQAIRNDQIENEAGGYVWATDKWARLRRFLILGSEGGSYYTSERDLTRQNIDVLRECIFDDGLLTVKSIVEISDSGRAPKNDQALYALAACISFGDKDTRVAAGKALPKVARIGTHLFQFISYAESMRGWGKVLRKAVSGWYDKNPDQLALQAIKYRQRDGVASRDPLRLAHPQIADPLKRDIIGFISGNVNHQQLVADGQISRRVTRWEQNEGTHRLIDGYLRAQKSESAKQTAQLVRDFRLPREALKTEHLNDNDVWQALLDNGMPMTALVRNLATMTRNGLLTNTSEATKIVLAKLADQDEITKSRIHPFNVFVAQLTYASGRGLRGQNTWTPVGSIVDALDAAFYQCLVPETKVLTASLEWVALGEIQVGDKLVAVDEHVPGGSGPQRKMQTATVEDRWESTAPTFKITFSDGREIIASDKHRFLARKRWQTATEWRAVKDMRVGDVIRWVTRPWSAATAADGWMGGLLDGEGHLAVNGAVRLSVSQVEGPVLSRARSYLADRDYTFSEQNGDSPSHVATKTKPVHVLAVGRMDEVFRLVGQTGTARWNERSWWEGRGLPGKSRGMNGWEKIVSIEPAGVREVIDIQTSTGTFIAEGFVSHNSFGNVDGIPGSVLIGLDTSGSMQHRDFMGVPGITPARAQAVMALVTVATSQDVTVIGFDTGVYPLAITARQRLDDVYRTSALGHGHGTDCSLPMLWATQQNHPTDAFLLFTDGQTWAGRSHPAEALTRHRQTFNRRSRLAMVAMVANRSSLGDPQDPGAMEFVGFDSATPQLIAEFARGNL